MVPPTADARDSRAEIARLEHRLQQLASLVEVGALVGFSLDLTEVLNLMMQKAQAVAEAGASCILLLNERTGKLEFAGGLRCVAAWVRGHAEAVVASLGIAGQAARLEPVRLPALIERVRGGGGGHLGCPRTPGNGAAGGTIAGQDRGRMVPLPARDRGQTARGPHEEMFGARGRERGREGPRS